MDPITILLGIKTGMAAGKTIAGQAKKLVTSYDATDAAKKQYKKRCIRKKRKRHSDERVGFLRANADSERELQEWLPKPMADQNGWSLKYARSFARKTRGDAAGVRL